MRLRWKFLFYGNNYLNKFLKSIKNMTLKNRAMKQMRLATMVFELVTDFFGPSDPAMQEALHDTRCTKRLPTRVQDCPA